MALQGNARKSGKIRMAEIRQRRSPRGTLELPIRVSGTDFQGKDFVEDSATLVVSRHGAKIRLRHKLIPEQEIQILCHGNNREGLFRVVSQAGKPTSEFSFWGVECLTPGEDIWEGDFRKASPRPGPKPSHKPASRPSPRLSPRPAPQPEPKPSPNHGSLVQAVLRCSKCGMRELMELDETQIQAMRKLEGLVRGCPACGATGLWKRVAGKGS